MSREHRNGLVVLTGLVLVGLFVALGDDAVADTPVSSTTSAAVVCKPYNLVTPDAGMTIVECGTGYRAAYLETESTSPAYICGSNGAGTADGGYARTCLKRCVGCNNGSAFAIDGNRGTLKCVSGTADAGVLFQVHCGR